MRRGYGVVSYHIVPVLSFNGTGTGRVVEKGS